MKIYRSYQDEPEELFSPLDPVRYATFYDIEMAEYNSDLPFYLTHLQPRSKILELGCGSGRLTRLLADNGHCLTAIDLSPAMLALAHRHPRDRQRYLCMDMRRLAFHSPFEAIIIPYNTLNLLADPADVSLCLSLCRRHLRTGGILLLHLYIPPLELRTSAHGLFQFQLFPWPHGGRLLKESIRRFIPLTLTILLEERYKIRPLTAAPHQYRHLLRLCGWSDQQWRQAIETAGFAISPVKPGPRQSPSRQETDSSTLLIVATAV